MRPAQANAHVMLCMRGIIMLIHQLQHGPAQQQARSVISAICDREALTARL